MSDSQLLLLNNFLSIVYSVVNNIFKMAKGIQRTCPTCGKPMELSRLLGRPIEWICDRDIMDHYESALVN